MKNLYHEARVFALFLLQLIEKYRSFSAVNELQPICGNIWITIFYSVMSNIMLLRFILYLKALEESDTLLSKLFTENGKSLRFLSIRWYKGC